MKKILISLVLIIVIYGVSYGQNPIESEAYRIGKMDYARGWHELFADVNNDGRDEFVCVKERLLSAGLKKIKLPPRVYVYTWITKKQIKDIEVDLDEYELILENGKFVREWVSREFDEIKALAVGDANNNGRNEVVIATSEIISGYERNEKGCYILAYRFEMPNSEERIFNLFVGDIDGDRKKEIVISTSKVGEKLEGYGGTVLVCRISLLSWGGKSFTKKWESDTFESFDCLPSVSIADIDGDGREEILVYLPEDLAIWANGFLWKYDSKAKRYEKESIKEYIGKGADIDGDGYRELIRGIFGERLRVKKLELVKWKDEKITIEKVIDMSIAWGFLGPIGYNVTGEKEINIVFGNQGGLEENYNVLYGAR